MPSLGAAVNFAFSGTDGIAESGYLTSKSLLQSASLANSSDEFQVADATGALKTREFYNAGFRASLEYVVTGSTIAAARTNTTIPVVGTILSITACASIPGLVKTNWVVVGEPVINLSNTSAARVTLSLESHAGVTAVATAS